MFITKIGNIRNYVHDKYTLPHAQRDAKRSAAHRQWVVVEHPAPACASPQRARRHRPRRSLEDGLRRSVPPLPTSSPIFLPPPLLRPLSCCWPAAHGSLDGSGVYQLRRCARHKRALLQRLPPELVAYTQPARSISAGQVASKTQQLLPSVHTHERGCGAHTNKR